MKLYSLSKNERLTREKAILSLFSTGKSLFIFPVRLVYIAVEEDSIPDRAQAAFSVPKKRFKRAVKRNLLKRRMREAYRLIKPRIYDELGQMNKKATFMLIYAGSEELSFSEISSSIQLLLEDMVKRMKNEKIIDRPTDIAH
ncbi:MAG TPA: ribonuclease P protein component [Williamwhitmania sp.]|nr:ribonuclease P protein component [Williamwhitmania sp.]